jgi:hypothetical protein
LASNGPDRWKSFALALLVFVPILFNAITLFPEVSRPVPSLNDDAVHYLLIQRASEALRRGENIFDHWLPELELGFPFFFYYQHLPHLAIVALHRLLFQQADLLTLFNFVRYLLLVAFPLTVYWSMRRLEFSAVAAAVGAAGASLISSNHRYGLEYDSYVWRGLGVYTQLWAMHLYFIVLACLYRLIERGAGYGAAVLSCSILGLSHLLYSYMLAITVLVLFLLGLDRANWRARIARLAITGGLVLVACSYMWLPYLFQTAFFGWSPYLQNWKYDSFGAREILTWLVNGDLLDYGRFPVLTVLLALGIAAALLNRNRPGRMALALFTVWLALYFGRPTWGRMIDILPLHNGLLLHRFVGSLDVAAIFLIGLGGEWLWRNVEFLISNYKFNIQPFESLRVDPEQRRTGQNSTFNIHSTIAGLVLLALLTPALSERQRYYVLNVEWMERTQKALDRDADARAVLAALKELPPGRAYAGLRANWGKDLAFGDVHFYDLLTFNRIAAVSPPYSGISLNADLIWHFDDRNPAHYNLLNVKYVVAPRNLPVADFLRPIKETRRYLLYRAETGGYADFVTVSDRKSPPSQAALFFQNRNWFESAEPGMKRAVRYDYPPARSATAAAAVDGGPACPGGKIREEEIAPGRIDLEVECATAATLVVKMTYHPNWRVAVDGRDVAIFMLSPSFIGFDVPAGKHQVRAEYRAAWLKMPLLILGASALAGFFLLRGKLEPFDARLSARAALSLSKGKDRQR